MENGQLSGNQFSGQLESMDWRIEALRGIAASMVVFAHYWPMLDDRRFWFQFVFTGVDLFFVLSGFVFAPYLFGRTSLPYRAFLIRRGFRIYPFYLVSLGVYVATHWLAGRSEFPYLIDHLLLLHTTHSKEIAFYYNPAYWSLPPEVEFYLVLPLLARCVAGRSGRFVVLLLISALLHIAIVYPQPATRITAVFFGALSVHLPGLLIEFLLGAAVWRLLGAVGPSSGVLRLSVLLMAMTGWFVLAHLWALLGDEGFQAHSLLRGNKGVLAAFFFACLVWVLLVSLPCQLGPGALGRFIRQCALLAGALSYGLYLLHNATPMLLKTLGWPAQSSSLLLASLILALVLAAIGHWLIEKPARKFGRRLSRRFAA